MTPFGEFPDFEDKHVERKLSDDDVRWLVLWVTQVAKRYMSNEDLPDSVTNTVERLHAEASTIWGKGKLASTAKQTAVTMETVRRLVLRSRVHPLLTEATELESTEAQIRALFSEAGFEPAPDLGESLAAYFDARKRGLLGAKPAGKIAYKLCEAPGAGTQTLSKVHTTLNKVFGTDYPRHEPEHLAAFLTEHDLRFESDLPVIEFFLHDIMQMKALNVGKDTEDREVHQLSFRDAEDTELSRGRLATLRNMTKQQLSDLRANDPDQFRKLVGSALEQLFAADHASDA